ncbi:hypothetical protein CEXT_663961 [Caerostris extrusa]|uniref:Uncharacterized protein n=1 Tax=Caerostris extrusa TaxID=172846 RepID=A0AAV4N2T0_CAEEX|nr:hypothetical protein CEXT_663961 [Caerostris extrusa]
MSVCHKYKKLFLVHVPSYPMRSSFLLMREYTFFRQKSYATLYSNRRTFPQILVVLTGSCSSERTKFACFLLLLLLPHYALLLRHDSGYAVAVLSRQPGVKKLVYGANFTITLI